MDTNKKGVIWDSQLSDERLIICFDGTLDICNKDYEICLSINENSREIFSCLQLKDGRLITISKDKSIKVVKLEEDNKYTIESSMDSENDDVVKIIEIKNNQIISVSIENSMKICDFKEFKNKKL